MNIPSNRDNLGSWLNDNNLTGYGVEVGALSGVYSEIILSSWKGNLLYLVDPWETQSVDVYREDDGRFNHLAAYEQAQELKAKDPRAMLLKMLSADAAALFPETMLDFVYIDANHDYEFVLQDMTVWWPKILPGGIMCGHDFYNCLKHPFWNEVERAVKQWSSERSIPFEVTPSCSSWWMPKPV
jgi:hypothetical protein